jgi:signal transduction histidine kinase/DNA-binding response OmpR family regulator
MDITLNFQTLLESLLANFGMFAGLFTLLTILPYFLKNNSALLQQVIIGLIFGAAAALSIFYSVEFVEGVHLDSRVAIISMASLFFGPLTAFITIIPAILMRLTLDGEVTLGIVIILVTALCGVLLRAHIYKNAQLRASLKQIALFALIMPVIIIIITLAFVTSDHTGEIILSCAIAFLAQNFTAIFVLGVLLNVNSKNIALENDLDEAAALATTASNEKTEFIGMMSHEIRTPMSGVLGFTEILEQTDLDDYQRHCVEQVKTAGSTMMHLLDDILDFSRIESCKFSLSLAPLDFKETLQSTFEMMHSEKQSNNNKMTLNIDDNVPQYILGDMHRIKQIIYNILGNAIKFTDQGTINVHAHFTPDVPTKDKDADKGEASTAQEKGSISIVISDTGIGIAPQKQNIIFSMFEQENPSIPHIYGGSGLGLAIVQSLVSLMGGDIEVQSQVGIGTTFTINLPYLAPEEGFDIVQPIHIEQHASEQPQGSAASMPAAPVVGDNRFILLAEDIKMNQELTASMLIQNGFQVHVVNNGVEAIEAVKNNGPFHLVLMDINMPEMNGIDATIYIRNTLNISSADLPIIALTAHVMGDEINDCIKAGMNDYLSKPIKAATLVEKVSAWAKPMGVDSFDSLLCSLPSTPAEQAANAKTNLLETKKTAKTTAQTEQQENRESFSANPFSGLTSETSPYLDIEMITQFIQFIGKDKITDVFKSFELDLEQRITAMEDSDFDLEIVKFETHALSSTSGNLGMLKLSLYCREMVDSSQDNANNADGIKNRSKHLRDIAKASCLEFSKYMNEE